MGPNGPGYLFRRRRHMQRTWTWASFERWRFAQVPFRCLSGEGSVTGRRCRSQQKWRFYMVLYGFMGKSWEYMGLPSGKHTKSYWKWPNGHRNSGFTHKKGWFSIAMLVYRRVILNLRFYQELCTWFLIFGFIWWILVPLQRQERTQTFFSLECLTVYAVFQLARHFEMLW